MAHDLFSVGIPIGEKLARTIAVYVFLLVGLRLAGKRELGQLNPFDLVVLLLLSNTLQNAIIGEDNSLAGGIIGATSLLVLNWLVVRFLYTHPVVARWLEGDSDVLIKDGTLLEQRLQRELITKEELEAAARRQGLEACIMSRRAGWRSAARSPSCRRSRVTRTFGTAAYSSASTRSPQHSPICSPGSTPSMRAAPARRIVHPQSRTRCPAWRAATFVVVALACTATNRTLGAQVPASRPRVEADSTLATVRVRVLADGRPLEAALVRSGIARDAVGARTDARGIATLALGAGARWLVASKAGYRTDSIALTLRAGADTTVLIELRASEPAGEPGEAAEHAASLSGVVVTATRSQRRVEAEPTRVDVLGEEEIQEKTSMTPGSSAMLLSETGGVHVAATSAGLGGANVRVQGLRGRYTQLLSDGLPLYGLSTEGLGLLQIPPIDLRQVELIKGAASALYGPGALGGVINFVSRRPPVLLAGRPRESRELYVNQTSLGGSDVALFDARALSSRWGYTLLATGNRQGKRDLNGDGWADVPSYERGVVRPRLYWTGADGSDLFFTTGVTAENRRGGTDVSIGEQQATALRSGPFAQARDTRRADAGAVAHVLIGGGRVLTLRASATDEWRRATYGRSPDAERDRRSTRFGEAALTLPFGAAQELVLGAAVQRDGYAPRDVPALAYTFTVPALFAQHTWTPAPWFGLTSSARLDAHSEYGTTLSPRVSALVRPWSRGPLAGWTARVSGGTGTYAPTPFVEETEEIGLRDLRPIAGGTNGMGLRAERARSGSADVGGVLGPLELNAAVYASRIDHAVGLRAVEGPTAGDSVELINATSPTRTRGAQLFARYRAREFSVTGSYDYQRATEQDVESDVEGARRGVPLTPRHAAGATASWESESGTGLACEGFYTGRQPLADDPYRSESPPYFLFGALARMRVGRATVYVNGENLGNVRQTHYDPLLLRAPGRGGRWTTDVWAPLDGAVVNGGVRIGF